MNQAHTKLALIIGVIVTFCMLLVTLGAQTGGPQSGQTPAAQSHSVWDGVYTQQQAQRGHAIYDRLCSSCHDEKLTGKESEDSPALTGRDFEIEWDGRTAGDMFRKILRKMPQDKPGRLSPQESVDLVAFILSFNGRPAGKTELPPQNEILVGIHFEAKKREQK